MTAREVRALVPEPGRRARLAKAPAPGRLAGLVFGVKDIIAVDGLPTTGGSMLPPAAL